MESRNIVLHKKFEKILDFGFCLSKKIRNLKDGGEEQNEEAVRGGIL